MRTCFGTDPLTVDPRKGKDRISLTFLSLLFDGLTELTRDQSVHPALAEAIEVDRGGTSYLFHLKKAYWSDGHAIVAEDFVYSWQRGISPSFASPSASLFIPIQNARSILQNKESSGSLGVFALDSRTLRVDLETPSPDFLSLLASPPFLPIPKHIDQHGPQWSRFPIQSLVSSGPFVIESWEPKEKIALSQNPFYWNRQALQLSRIDILIIQHETLILEFFEQGKLDWISSLLAPLSPSFDLYKKAPAPLSKAVYRCNLRQFPFQNLSIRKALFLSINLEKLLQDVGLPPQKSVPTFHPQLAKKLLRQGLVEEKILQSPEDPLPEDDWKVRRFLEHLTISYENSPLHHKTARSLQEQWTSHLGYRFKLIPCSTKTHFDSLQRKDFNVILESHFPASLEEEKELLGSFTIGPLYKEIFPDISSENVEGIFRSPLGIPQLKRASLKKLNKIATQCL